MKSTIWLLFLVLFAVSTALAQPPAMVGRCIPRVTTTYKEFVLNGNRLYALTDADRLVVWDLDRLDTLHHQANAKYRVYTAIAKDRNNDIVLGTDDGTVFRLDSSGQAQKLLKSPYKLLGIGFNQQNRMFLISRYGIRDAVSKKEWSNFLQHPSYFRREPGQDYLLGHKEEGYFMPPDFTFLDGHGRWWLCAGYGEFGSEIELFDTENSKIIQKGFDSLDLDLTFPQSVFEDSSGNVYVSSGLQHMMNWGEIFQIDPQGNVRKIFDGILEADSLGRRSQLDAIFVGPAAFNRADGWIYFASTKGFYKMEIPALGAIAQPIHLFRPKLEWTQEPMAVGIAMSIKQLLFAANGKMVFRTLKNGIGVYDGRELVFLQ